MKPYATDSGHFLTKEDLFVKQILFPQLICSQAFVGLENQALHLNSSREVLFELDLIGRN